MTETAQAKATEKAAMEALKRQEKVAAGEEVFNFTTGQKLPEGYENPPCGDPKHRCVDQGGLYRPDWFQIKIERVYDRQTDPQDFPLMGVTYQVPLDEWVDAPPGVLESLKSAVEVHHSFNATPGMIALGQHPEHKKIERHRFVYRDLPSA
jgi:hypothetical protein